MSAWTDEQRRAIERRRGDLLLDAAAGSGKTSVLVERFASAVLHDGIEVGAILAITFTDKAAAELRDRIRARLRELGAGEAARQAEGALISTIHGFCARVLRGHALAAGLDPAFAVLDRDQSGPLAAAAFEESLVQLARHDDRVVDLIAAHGAPALRHAILSVHDQLRSSGETAPRLPECPPVPDDGAPQLARAAAAVAGELAGVVDPSARVLDALHRARRCRELPERPGDIWPPKLEALRLPRNGTALSTDACVAYSDALERYRSAAAARAAAPVRDVLDRLLAAYGARYRERKRAVSGLDFEDLELLTRDLLAGSPELCDRYRDRFAAVMVDELQDVNRVQAELIESIAAGNLFTVGDAQQSIYGFRHAEVELFERRGQRLAASGARLTLTTNFRSRAEILEVVNHAFGPEDDPAHVGFRRLRAGRSDPPRTGAAVELVMVDKGADWELEGVAAPWRLAEAAALARRVAELVDGGAAPAEIVVLIRATTDLRAYERALESHGLPTYVIGGRGYWSHPQVVDVVAYLRALANPRDEESLYGVLASPWVGASLDALIVLAAAARESGRDPWWVLREPGEGLAALADEDRGRLSAFTSWFAAERDRSARAGIEELIDAALRRSGYDLAMLELPGGTRRLANVRKLMRLGREHELERGPDLGGFLDLVADREAGRRVGGEREGEAPVEGEGLDAIRLMTIHRAKGLEFDVVCVADLGRSPRPPSEILRVRDGRIGLRLARAGVAGRESALAYRELGEEQRRMQEQEERRLFYVAMTRARERLILSGAAKFEGWLEPGKPTGGGPIGWIAPALVPELAAVVQAGGGTVTSGAAQVEVRIDEPAPGGCAPPRDSAAPASGPPVAAVAAPDAVAVPPVTADVLPAPSPPLDPARRAAPIAALSYSSLQEYARCGYRFYAERVLGLPGPAAEPREVPARDPIGPRDAADRGVLVHALLERLDFRRPAIPDACATTAAAARAGLWPAPGPQEADELSGLVRGFAASELCARLGRATEVRREQRFAFALDADPAHPLVVGAFDVLAREPGNLALVVDYKSDRLDGADPAAVVRAAYGTQRLIYALAALHAGADRVEIVHCFLQAPEQPVVAGFERGAMAELEAELRSLAAGVLARRFRVTDAPHRSVCAGCPAEGGLCSWPLQQTRREAADRLF